MHRPTTSEDWRTFSVHSIVTISALSSTSQQIATIFLWHNDKYLFLKCLFYLQQESNIPLSTQKSEILENMSSIKTSAPSGVSKISFKNKYEQIFLNLLKWAIKLCVAIFTGAMYIARAYRSCLFCLKRENVKSAGKSGDNNKLVANLLSNCNMQAIQSTNTAIYRTTCSINKSI